MRFARAGTFTLSSRRSACIAGASHASSIFHVLCARLCFFFVEIVPLWSGLPGRGAVLAQPLAPPSGAADLDTGQGLRGCR